MTHSPTNESKTAEQMTNLTDEGLREMVVMALSDLFVKKPTPNKHWSEIGWEDVNSMTSEDMLKAMVILLQQVRDAAKKEERAKCAEIAQWNWANHTHGKNPMYYDRGWHEASEKIQRLIQERVE